MKIKKVTAPSDTFDLAFPAGTTFDVVGFGLNSVDSVYVVPGFPGFNTKTEILRHETLPGGQVATAILFLARSGCSVRYIGKIGGDDSGRFFLKQIEKESIDISSIVVEKGARNQYSVIVIDQATGERTILWQRDGLLDFRISELDTDSIRSGKILHLDGYDFEAAAHAASLCRESGIPVSIDLDRAVPGCERLIQGVDFLIASSDFCSQYTGISDAIEAFRKFSGSLDSFCVMTMGSEGAVASVGGRCLAFPGLEIRAVDTTGAGDIFHGAFLFGLLRNWSIERIMAFANAAAGLSCEYLGAQTGIRPLSEILLFADRLSLQPSRIL